MSDPAQTVQVLCPKQMMSTYKETSLKALGTTKYSSNSLKNPLTHKYKQRFSSMVLEFVIDSL